MHHQESNEIPEEKGRCELHKNASSYTATNLPSHKPWIRTHRCTRVGRPTMTYIYQLCANTGCSFEDLPG